MSTERDMIEQALATGQPIANWPPSRGPKPPDDYVSFWRWRKPTIAMRQTDERLSLVTLGSVKGATAEYGFCSHVLSVSRLTAHVAASVLTGAKGGSAGGLLPEQAIMVDLPYPLSRTARVTVYPYQIARRPRSAKAGESERLGRPHQSLGYFLWQIARVYRRIYKDHERWGVWGHGLEDLWFEHIKVRDGVAILGMGS